MSARKSVLSSTVRAIAIGTIAALVLSAAAPSSAFAGSRYRGAGGAAAAAAFAGVVGTGLAIAASQNRYGYYDGYYAGPPAVVVVPQAYPYGGYGNYGYGGYGGGNYGYVVPDGH